MEAAITIGILAVLIGIGISIPKLNNKCLVKYEYKPFSLGNAGLSFISWIVLIIILMIAPSDGSGIVMATSNSWVLFGLYFLIVIGMLWNIISKTSVFVGLYTVLVLQLFSLIAVLIIAAARAFFKNE
jgi:hypothetical protein